MLAIARTLSDENSIRKDSATIQLVRIRFSCSSGLPTYSGIGHFLFLFNHLRDFTVKCSRAAGKPSGKLACGTDRPTTQSDSYSFLCPESTAAVFRTKLTPSLFKPTSSPLVG